MIGDYFTPGLENPEAPRLSFFRGLFSGGPTTSTLDREELFGPGTPQANAAAANSRAGAASGKSAVDMRAKVSLDIIMTCATRCQYIMFKCTFGI